MKAVLFTGEARKAFRALPAAVQVEIKAKLHRYAEGGSADVTRLKGVEAFRMRVRDYRVIFVETEEAVEVRAVGHRREIYR